MLGLSFNDRWMWSVMAGYVGTEQQIVLQMPADLAIDWMRSTPGACNPGRCLGTDDPDRLSLTSFSEAVPRGPDLWLIFTLKGYDEPKSSSMRP